MVFIRRLREALRALVAADPLVDAKRLPPGDPRRTDSLVEGVDDGEDLVASLVAGGVLVERGSGLVLSTGFAEGWRTEMDDLAALDDRAFARAVAGAAPGVEEAALADDEGREFVVVERGGETLWVSRPVAIAEVAAIRSLPETVPPDHRLAAARPLRLFLEECPDCGGRVDTIAAEDWPLGDRPDDDEGEEVLLCFDCGERLYTY